MKRNLKNTLEMNFPNTWNVHVFIFIFGSKYLATIQVSPTHWCFPTQPTPFGSESTRLLDHSSRLVFVGIFVMCHLNSLALSYFVLVCISGSHYSSASAPPLFDSSRANLHHHSSPTFNSRLCFYQSSKAQYT